MAARKDKRESAAFFSKKEALVFSSRDTKGETSIAICLYHIHHKPARLHLPSYGQVFLYLPLLQFAYSKRFLAPPKQEDGM